jgi:hypothetical protein
MVGSPWEQYLLNATKKGHPRPPEALGPDLFDVREQLPAK